MVIRFFAVIVCGIALAVGFAAAFALYQARKTQKQPMDDKPNGKRLIGNHMSRIDQRSKASPNGRLAIFGLILVGLYAGFTSAAWAMERPLVDYLSKGPAAKLRWDLFQKLLQFVGMFSFIALCVGMTIIAFAAYRALRDYLSGR
jgi:hypothetical protein